MPRRRADAVVDYPGQPKVVASVATTRSVIVLTVGDGRQEHYTYPEDGRFHVTEEDPSRGRAFFAPGPPYDQLDYRRFAIVLVPEDPSQLVRDYHRSSAHTMSIPGPTGRDGILEVAVMGRHATPEIVQSLCSQGATVATFQGPRSDTTVVFRYMP
jgi:hypothetical protein